MSASCSTRSRTSRRASSAWSTPRAGCGRIATNKAFERTLGYHPHETGGVLFWERYVADGERAEARDCDPLRDPLGRVRRVGGPLGAARRRRDRRRLVVHVAAEDRERPGVADRRDRHHRPQAARGRGAALTVAHRRRRRRRTPAARAKSARRCTTAADRAAAPAARCAAGSDAARRGGRRRRHRARGRGEGAARAGAGDPPVGAQRARARRGASHRRCARTDPCRARRHIDAARGEHQRRGVLHRQRGVEQRREVRGGERAPRFGSARRSVR